MDESERPEYNENMKEYVELKCNKQIRARRKLTVNNELLFNMQKLIGSDVRGNVAHRLCQSEKATQQLYQKCSRLKW